MTRARRRPSWNALQIESLERRCLFTAGDLDGAFGSGGTVVGGPTGPARATAVQSDGKIVVAGSAGGDFVLARYNTDGSPDSSFGTNGSVSTNIGGASDAVYALALQSDGKIIAGGTDGTRFALARYTTAGVLDSTFGTLGITTTTIPADSAAVINGLAVRTSTNQIYAVGGSVTFSVARYSSGGIIDTAFDTDGIAQTVFSNRARAFDVAIQTDGKPVVVGDTFTIASNENDFAVARYTTAGALDTTFSTDGKDRIAPANLEGSGVADETARGIAMEANNWFYVGGNAGSSFAVARYTNTGALTTSFGSNGVVTSTPGWGIDDSAFAIAVGSGGRVVLGGRTMPASGNSGGSVDFTLMRFHSDGGRDYGFGEFGRVYTSFTTTGSDEIRALRVQADGKLLAAGSTGAGQFAMARYDGTAANNTVPIANAGGPWFIPEHRLGSISGALSTDPGGFIVKYEWDLNYDGTFDPFTSGSSSGQSFDASNIDGPTTRQIALRVTDDRGAISNISVATLTVVNVAPQLSASGKTHVASGSTYALSLEALDQSTDTVSSWQIDWGDGSGVQTVPGTATSVTHPYALGPGATATIIVTATDEDGTYTANRGSLNLAFGPQFVDLPPAGLELFWRPLLLPDGRVLVVAQTGGTAARDFVLARYLANGSLDTTFGTGGYATLNFGTLADPNVATSDYAKAIALTSDNKILVAGQTTRDGGALAVARFSFEGQLDTSFGVGGRATADVVPDESFWGESADAIAVAADGSFVLAGTGLQDSVLARFDATGTLDPSFDGDGKVRINGGSSDGFSGVAILEDGRVVAGGVGYENNVRKMTLARFTQAGALDATFDGDGKVYALPPGASAAAGNDMTMTPDGKFVVAGWASRPNTTEDWAIARFNADGSLDSGFGTGGFFVHAPTAIGAEDELWDVEVTADGSIYAAGGTPYHVEESALLKLTVGGALDASFGTGGVVLWGPTQIGSSAFPNYGLSIHGDVAVTVGSGFVPGPSGPDGPFLIKYHLTDAKVAIGPAQPSVTSSAYALPSAVTVGFNTPVWESLAGGDLQLVNLLTSQTIPGSVIAIHYDHANERATFTFPGLAGGALPSGYYEATLAAADVTDQSGNPLTASCVFRFITVAAGDTLTLPAGVRTASALAIAPGGKLDLGSGSVVLDYDDASPIGAWNGTDYSGVQGLIRAGRNGGAWSGSGIVTTMSDAQGIAALTTIAAVESSLALQISGSATAPWRGVNVDATSVLIGYGIAGDVNASGTDASGGIDADDYFAIDSGYAQSLVSHARGDIDYSGSIDADDYFLIDQNYSRTFMPASAMREMIAPTAIVFARNESVYEKLMKDHSGEIR